MRRVDAAVPIRCSWLKWIRDRCRLPLALVSRILACLLAMTVNVASSEVVAADPGSAGNALLLSQTALAIGVYRPGIPESLGDVRELEGATSGRFSILHWYVSWGEGARDFNFSDLQIVRQHGSTPLISWEPWAGTYNDPAWSLNAAILSGRSDSYIRSWARGLAAYGGPVLLRFAHEMHDSSYPWSLGVNGNSAAEYVQAWRHVHAIFDDEHATNVQWVWNPNLLAAGTSAERYGQVFSPLYPGDDVVDWTGLDIYNTGTNNWALPYWPRSPYWQTFTQLLYSPYRAITAISTRPLILPEVASAEAGGSKAEWIAGAMNPSTLSQFPLLQAMVWFDLSKEEYWALGSTPQALQAWVTAARPFMIPGPASVSPPQTPQGPVSSSVTVTMDDQWGFSPQTVTVAVGGTVTWVNKGQKVHTAVSNQGVSPSFDSGGLDNGQQFTFTFTQARSYQYHSSTEPIYSLDELGHTIVTYQFNGTVNVQ